MENYVGVANLDSGRHSITSQTAELILKWLGVWAGPLPTIFRGPPTNKWLESLSKTEGKPRKIKESQGTPTKTSWQDPLPITLKMSSAINLCGSSGFLLNTSSREVIMVHHPHLYVSACLEDTLEALSRMGLRMPSRAT